MSDVGAGITDVFISYARRDGRLPIVQRLSAIFAAHRLDVWYDRDLTPGAAFNEEILTNIQKATTVCPLLCSESAASPWVRFEMQAGLNKLMPIRLQDVQFPSPLPSHTHCVDLFLWTGAVDDPRLGSLIETMRARAGITAPRNQDTIDLLRDAAPLEPLAAAVNSLPSEDVSAVWPRIGQSLDPAIYELYLQLNANSPHAILATIQRDQCRAWQNVDKTSAGDIASFRADASARLPLFAALERATFDALGAVNRRREIDGETAWVRLPRSSRRLLREFMHQYPEHKRTAEAKTLLERAPTEIERVVHERNLAGHGLGGVNNATFSPDGLTVLTAGADGTARTWDSQSGAPIRTLQVVRANSSEGVLVADYSIDGHRIATADENGAACVWDSATGELLYKVKPSFDCAFDVSLSPDNGWIAVAATNNEALLQTIPETRSRRLQGHRSWPRAIAYSWDGRRVATGADDNIARIFDASTLAVVARAIGHDGPVCDVRFSPDGARIVTASSDKTARIWDAASGALLKPLLGHRNPVSSAVFSPDSSRVLTGSWDGTFRLWDGASGVELYCGHADGSVTSAEFSGDGSRIIVATRGGSASIWRIEE